jgi:hypothetical protein
MSLDEIIPIFQSRLIGDECLHSLLDQRMSISLRRNRSQMVPSLLKVLRLLTQKEHNDIGYLDYGERRHYVIAPCGTKVPFGKWFSPVEVKALDLFDKMAEIQRLALDPVYLTKLRAFVGPGHFAKKGDTFDIGITFQSGGAGIQLGVIGRPGDPVTIQLIKLVAEVATKLLYNAFPEIGEGVRDRRWHLDASTMPA